MLSSVLLHLEGAKQAESVIRWGIRLAAPSEARVRGLTLLDTRRIESALACEAAVYAVAVQSQQLLAEHQQELARVNLSRACLEAGLNFDVRRASGDPMQLLPQECRYHDLVLSSLADALPSGNSPGLTPQDLMALLERGVQPVLVVRQDQRRLDRVLLVYDGSEASGRTIRSFLSLIHLPNSEHRLLAIGRDEKQARVFLREMADYCLDRQPQLETGCLAGRTRRLLLPYAEKWQANLIVLGVSRANRMWQRLWGNVTLDVWRKLTCGLYLGT